MRNHLRFVLAVAISTGVLACDPGGPSQPERDLGVGRAALKLETALNSNASTVNEGATVQISGGGVTTTGASENVVRVEVFWGERNPATGAEFKTTVCDTPDPAVADCPTGGSTSICQRLNAASPVSSHVYRQSLDSNGASAGDHSVTCVVSYNVDPATTLLLKDSGGVVIGITVNEVASTVDSNVSSAEPDSYSGVVENQPFNPTASFTDPSVDTGPNPDQLYERYECSIDFDNASTTDTVQFWPRRCASAADCIAGDVCNTGDTVGGVSGRCRTTAEESSNTLPTCRPEHLSDSSKFSFTYPASGTYTMRVAVTNLDADGTTSTDDATVTVTDAVPSISGLSASPSPGAERAPVTFTAMFANGSPSEPITRCTWDPDDSGSIAPQTFAVGTPECKNDGSASTFSFTYPDGDDTNYTLRVTVEDADSTPPPGGNAASSTLAITIANVAATTAAPTSSSALIEGNNITFDSSITDSPDENWLTRWELDGTSAGFERNQCRTAQGAISATYLYMEQGTYDVLVRVRDQLDPASATPCNTQVGNSLAADSATVSFTVADATPSVVSLTNDGPKDEGQTITFTYEIRSGAKDNTAADPIARCIWSFGDGTAPTTITAGNPGCETEAAGRTYSHPYADSGSYSARLTVEDEEGNASTGTLTTAVTINNVPPTVALDTANAKVVNEGTTLTVRATFTDPAGAADRPYSCVFSWGDGQTTTVADCTSPVTAAHNYPDDSAQDGTDADSPNVCGKATCTVTVTVTDKDGGPGSAQYEVSVTNANPIINGFSSTSPVAEGEPVSVTVTAADPGTGDSLLYDFDWNADGTCDAAGQGDVCATSLNGASHVYPNQGSYKVRVTVRDDDGGSAVTVPDIDVVVTDVKPKIVSIFNTGPKSENQAITAVILTESQSGDSYTFTWDFGDGSSVKSADLPTGSCVTANGCTVDPACTRACSHVYSDDRAGGYTVTATVADDDGNSTQATTKVTIENLPPTGAASNSGPISEGGTATVSATVSDVPADVPALRCHFDFNSDGVNEVSNIAAVAGACSQAALFADDGDYTVTVTLDDQDGGLTRVTTTVVVRNVAPTAVVAAGCTSASGLSYSCDLDATDPALTNDTLTYTLVNGPAGMSIDPATGVISWIPTADQSRTSHAFTVRIADEDGGSTLFSRVVSSYLDTDSDGMPDVWEDANGTDKNVADANADPDNDGLTNAQELAEGTDPGTFDGPTGPVAISPIDGAEVTTVTPTLRIRNAVDPNGDAITYTFEVYDNAALSGTPITSPAVPRGAGVLQGGGTFTEWTVSSSLPDNATHYWRVRANDGATFGPSSDVESFFVNTANDAPTAPTASAPADGSAVPSRYPTLQVGNAADLDNDPLTYTFEISTNAAFTAPLVASASGLLEGESGITSWIANAALADDNTYFWRARANDGTVDGPNSVTGTFFVNTSNNPPSAVEIIAPKDGEQIATITPTLRVKNATDSDGDTLTYEFEIDRSPAFNAAARSGRIAQGGSGETAHVPVRALEENQLYYWRVRAFDGASAGDWSTASFFVNTINDAPSAPVPQNPLTGSLVDRESVRFTVRNATDPDSKLLSYTFAIYTDEALTSVHEEVGGVTEAKEETTFTPGKKLKAGATYWWSAKAVDEKGLEGPSSEPQVFKTVGVQGGGCGCTQAPPGALLAVLGAIGFALRRRRS